MRQALGIAAISLLVLAGGPAWSAGAEARYQVDAGERALLNELSAYIDGGLRDSDVAELAGLLDSADQAAGTLAASLLFRHRPEEYRHAVFERLAVRDYDLRDQGQYNVIEREAFLGAIAALEREQPGLVDSRMTMLVAYLHFRESNEWLSQPDGFISIARLLRTAFLTVILANSEISPLETANAIDRATQASMGY